jgi:hypothetical protein
VFKSKQVIVLFSIKPLKIFKLLYQKRQKKATKNKEKAIKSIIIQLKKTIIQMKI